MSTLLFVLLISTGYQSAPTKVATFQTEAQCIAQGETILQASRVYGRRSENYMSRVSFMCYQEIK